MINGDRVRQARELRRLTQTELAEAIGTNQSSIAQIEGSVQEPSVDRAQAIAAYTRFPLSFFEQPTTVDFPVGSLLFRARASTSGRDRTEAYRYAQTMFESALALLSRLKAPPVLLPTFVGEAPEGARLTRASLGLNPDKPIENLLNSIERAGVLVLALPVELEGRDAFAGWAMSEKPVPWMALSAGAPVDRLRWSAAHELGHLVLHRAPRGSVDEIERDADRFAAEFLLPETTLSQELITPVTLSQLAALKARWKVSIQALIRRARDLQIITDRQYKYLFQQVSAKGWRTKEPVPLEPERPRAVRQMAELLYGKPIDLGLLAAELHLSVELARDFIEQYVGADLLVPGESPPPSNVVLLRRKVGIE